MKIWIDLTNSPHVNFFADMVRDLRREHELLLTCRPLANTIELLDLLGVPYHVVGNHYGQSSVKKVFGFGIRISQLRRFLKNRAVDVAISHSSFYSPVVSKSLGIPCLYLNDNEHAEGNRISFFFADHILVPEYMAIQDLKRQWAGKTNVIRYPGVKEGVYLWQAGLDFNRREKESYEKRVIYIRPEPWTAQYYRGERNFMDALIVDLKGNFRTVLLPRGDMQKEYYSQEKFSGLMIPPASAPIAGIMADCDLFIGAGGTMTREAAVLGIPTISNYRDKLLAVDRYLIEKGLMIHKELLDSGFVESFLKEKERTSPDRELLEKGREAYELIKSKLLSISS